jgi:tRNA threonylcarbamoyladenosine biosynthesis protein TsaE
VLRIISRSETETMNLGARLVRCLKPGMIVCLFGELGAGKTILVKGMAGGLGISKDRVISPSFVLIREYLPVRKSRSRIPLYHLDLFRLNNPKDILGLGYEEYLYVQGICVIEWAQRMVKLLPAEYLKIELKIKGKTKRLIKLIANGKEYHKILKGIKR